MDAVQLIFFAAIVTKLVQALRDVVKGIPTWLLNLISFALGIVIAEIFKLDAVGALAGSSTTAQHAFGVIVTGLALGGGAAGLHDLLDFLSSAANARKAALPTASQE